MSYGITTGYKTREELVERINLKMAEGWEPFGAPFIDNNLWYQSMIWPRRTEYDIVGGVRSAYELVEESTLKIRQGWEPIGAAFMDNDDLWCQTMVKKVP